jgi:hypothetical protein
MSLKKNKEKKEKPKLKLDWSTHKAAKYACENWHYSRCLPSGKTVKIGVWEDEKFIGVVVYALGANPEIARMYGKTCELARVALNKHKTEVTRIISISIKLLIKLCPNLNAIISYADQDRHKGTIYKAGNWKYEMTLVREWISINGNVLHPRSIYDKYGTSSLKWIKENIDKKAHKVETKGKKRYVYYLRR